VHHVRDLVGQWVPFEISDTQLESWVSSGWSRVRFVLINSSFGILNGVTSVIFQVFFILVFMYYFYLYGPKLYKYVDVALPFSGQEKRLLKQEIKGNIRALILGQGLVALIQGVLCGIGFFIFGVPNVFLWTFVTVITAFIPFLGTAVTWVPAVIFLFIQGNTFSAIGLALWGLILVSNIDGVLRPLLVNSMSKLNFLTVLVGVIVGVSAFGLIGIVLGPLLISILITLLKIYVKEAVE
jgi:predicted PurR-regulated permease PerM